MSASKELYRDGQLLGEAAARPAGPVGTAASSGDWFTVAGLEVCASNCAGSVSLTVWVPALPCRARHALTRVPGHPAEVTFFSGVIDCCCEAFARHGDCAHIQAVSTIIRFADGEDQP